MPNLGDYLGYLMAEVTQARLQADLQSVRLAEYYAVHPLLKVFPVPRFRLPTLTMDIPVVISEIHEGSQLTEKEIEPRKLINRFKPILKKSLAQFNIKLNDSQTQAIDGLMKQKLESLSAPGTFSLLEVADNLVDEAMRIISGSEPIKVTGLTRARADFHKTLRSATRSAFLNLQKEPSRLSIRATSAEVKEAGDSVARLHLSIAEEAMEWHVEDQDGETKSRLVPE